ncbi:MAG: NAD(P)-dependent oxidoreductase [Candidatus Sungbacteria bacterium]|uniref:NAD(P)-dependent oxidoreductase n=1 Tax=Candidatus Sungiibacteriota bacterium TaxID=2750080 RepID=A0A933DT63_9BACT|nr:NAD(P)-dependent oxidoreductase [Candidatus Sungbacteria bacterium]
MDKVAVIGGSGFIGRHLPERLRDFIVSSLDLPEADIRNAALIGERIAMIKPDAVVHLAALLGGVGSQNIAELFRTNFAGTLNLLEACRMAGVKAFVFASSLTVHGSNDPAHPNMLDSPFRPIHAYGASKAAAEHAIEEYARRFGMTALALRPTMVLGDTPTPSAAIEFVRAGLSGEPIAVYGSGMHEREWLFVDDAADGFRCAIDFARTAAPGFYQFFLSGNRIAMADLARLCAEQTGGTIKFTAPTAKSFTLTCDTADSDARLGWQPKIELPEIIARLIALERQRRAV